MIVGRVLKCKGIMGEAEFTPQVRSGDFIYFKSNGRKVMCQIHSLQSTASKGVHGKFTILESSELPKIWANLYLPHQQIEGYIDIGVNEKGKPVKFRINPFFRHALVAGKTGKGKTHFQIVLAEEFLKHDIPSLVIDTQGEFIHLDKFSSNAVIVGEDITFEKILEYLKAKKTVVLNLQGLSYVDKTKRCYTILSQLREAKAQDYKQADNNVNKLKIPPIIVNIDETEVYAPDPYSRRHLNEKCRNCIIDIVKRDGKIGIGVVVSSQRLPALHRDVRSQCSSVMVFHVTDSGSRTVLQRFPYISPFDLKRLRNLERGEVLITGDAVPHPMLVMVRDIHTQRVKDLDFEKQLGLTPVLTSIEERDEVEEIREFEKSIMKGVSFELLRTRFPTRKIPNQGECVVIPERHFKPGWAATLETQGCKAVYCPDMSGGSVYIVRKDEKIKHKALT